MLRHPVVEIAGAADIEASVAAAEHVCGDHDGILAPGDIGGAKSTQVSIRRFAATRPARAVGLDTPLRGYWTGKSP
jgi:hypothetical protein